MDAKHSTAFDLTTTFITKIIFLGGSSIISIILARLLGPEGKGTVAALFVIPNLLVTMVDLGVRQVSAFYIGKRKYSIQQILSSSLLLWVITSILSVVIVLGYFLLPHTTTYSWGLMLIAIAYIPIKILISYFNGILQGQQKIGNLNIKFFIEFIGRLILVVFLVWWLDLSVTGAVLATLLTNVCVLIYSIFIIRQTAQLKVEYIKGVSQDMFRKGIVFAAALFIINLNYQLDIAFLENMVGSHDLGIYSVGVSLAELIWQLPAAIGTVLFARSANSATDLEASQRSAKLLRLSWPPVFIGGIILWIGAPFFVQLLYGQEFIEAGNVIRLLLPGIVVMVLFKTLNPDLAGRGYPLFALRIYLVTLAVNVGLNLLFIPTYGIYGAAIASTISYVLGAIIFTIAYLKHTGLHYKELFFINKQDLLLLRHILMSWGHKLKGNVRR